MFKNASKPKMRKPIPAYKALSGYLKGASFSELAHVGVNVITGSLGMKKPKIFAVGMNKAGTSSLHEIFVDNGYLSYHGIRWRSGRNKMLLNGFDGFSDGPPVDFKALDHGFPGSRFILNVREFDAWVLSRLKHITRDKKKRVGEIFPHDWDTTEEAIGIWLQERDRHHAELMTYFKDRPDDLLIVNFIRDPDAARKVARFLGKPEPDSKPWANPASGRGGAPEHQIMLDAVLQRNGLDARDARRDLIMLRSDANAGLPMDTSELDGAPIVEGPVPAAPASA